LKGEKEEKGRGEYKERDKKRKGEKRREKEGRRERRGRKGKEDPTPLCKFLDLPIGCKMFSFCVYCFLYFVTDRHIHLYFSLVISRLLSVFLQTCLHDFFGDRER